MIIEIDLVVVGKVVAVLYFLGMAGFLGFMLGRSKGYDEGSKSIKTIYGIK